MTTYDPDKRPEVTDEQLEQAEAMGFQIVNVLCDEPEAKVGDQTGVAFLVATPFIPRPGDYIRLEDGGKCQVQRVDHVVLSNPNAAMPVLAPNITAVRSTKDVD